MTNIIEKAIKARIKELQQLRQDLVDNYDASIDKSLESALLDFDLDEGFELKTLEIILTNKP